MHSEAFEYVERAVKGKTFYRVVEFGALDINGSVRWLFDCEDYWGIDLQDGPGVDEVTDAAQWRGEPADCIVCCEVLEHTPDLEGILRSAWENLAPGGLFIVTCATDGRDPHSAVDGGAVRPGEYYGNVNPVDLLTEARKIGFEPVDCVVEVNHSDLYYIGRKPL